MSHLSCHTSGNLDPRELGIIRKVLKPQIIIPQRPVPQPKQTLNPPRSGPPPTKTGASPIHPANDSSHLPHPPTAIATNRSSHHRRAHRKHPCRSLPPTKLQALRPKRLQHRCFPVNIAKSLIPAILKNICERLLLYLSDFSDQLVFREAIFQNSLPNILFLTFTSLLFHLIHLFH